MRVRRPVRIDVAKMAAAGCAMNFRTHHVATPIHRCLYCSRDWIVETRPARGAFEFDGGFEERTIATRTRKHTRSVFPEQCATAGHFRVLLAHDFVLLLRQEASALQPGGRRLAVSPAVATLRTHQRDHHDELDLRRVGQRVWGRDDYDGTTGSSDASLPHRRNGQRVLSIPP